MIISFILKQIVYSIDPDRTACNVYIPTVHGMVSGVIEVTPKDWGLSSTTPSCRDLTPQ